MVMIFTGQENIDDVIFFPMMRPAISPLNAAVYGVQEASIAPVEDLALSFEDFESLCTEGALKPHARHLLLKPHARFWSAAGGKARASGHVEIEGFLPNSVLRLAGYKIKSDQTLAEEEEKKKVAELIETSLVRFLKKKFPESEVIVSPVTVMRTA
jgi:hypothetical protein